MGTVFASMDFHRFLPRSLAVPWACPSVTRIRHLSPTFASTNQQPAFVRTKALSTNRK